MAAFPSLAKQLYGIAGAQSTFGGPRGIWLECRACPESHVIIGSGHDPIASYPDAQCAEIFRHHGWTGEGEHMLKAACPTCSAGIAGARSS